MIPYGNDKLEWRFEHVGTSTRLPGIGSGTD